MGFSLVQCAQEGEPQCLSCVAHGVCGHGQAVEYATPKLRVVHIKGSCVAGTTGSLGCLLLVYLFYKKWLAAICPSEVGILLP